MAIFQQSSLTYSAAKTIVTTAAGTVTDSDLLTLSGHAIQQAIERWNNKRYWTFLLTTAGTIGVDPSLGQDYLLPPDFNAPYDLRTLSNKRMLIPMTQREYGWADPYQQPGTPFFYGMFNSGGLGKLRLYPSPVSTDTLTLHYYRRMAIPMDTTSTDASCSVASNRLTFTGATTVSGSNVLTVASGAASAYPGEVITHANVPNGTTVSYVAMDTQIIMSANATASGAATATLGMTIATSTTTTAFNGFRPGAALTAPSQLAGLTVQRVIDPQTLQFSGPASATFNNQIITGDSSNTLLDLHADFERGILSLAKFYYLTDKGGDPQRIQSWDAEAKAAFAEAINRDSTVADDQLAFQPGYLAPQSSYPMNPNDIRWAWTDW